MVNRVDSIAVFLEIKNRVDSGGTAARRETWIKKFRDGILKLILGNEPLYRADKKYSLTEMLKEFGISTLEMYFGILFNLDGSPATLDGDRSAGFYSDSRTIFKDLVGFLEKQPGVKMREKNVDELKALFQIKGFEIATSTTYGDNVLDRLLRRSTSLTDLLVLKYDDIWLSQLVAIQERASLISLGKNHITIFRQLKARDPVLSKKYELLIDSEGDQKILGETVGYLLEKRGAEFGGLNIPQQFQKAETYLADVIAVLAASEA